METLLKIENANVRRADKLILDGVSLSIDKGEHTAIIGPNGAGKSTLMGVFSKEVHPLARDDYFYSLLGQSRWRIEDIRKEIGLVSPVLNKYLHSTYTAFEMVVSGLYSAIGLDFHHSITEEDTTLALNELSRVNALHLKDRCMNTLSSGEARRVFLARSAVHNPKILMLDEASDALDFPSRAILRESISSYSKEKTILMITHELSEIIPEINRIVLMKNGRIVKVGTKDEILNEELLSLVYERKVYVDKRDNLFNAWC